MLSLASACGLVLALNVTGCGAEYVDIDGYRAVYVSEPAGMEAYPHVVYNGATVYRVGHNYYRRHDGRWVAYHDVPPDLERVHWDVQGTTEWQRR
jgi:hypothetical protein